MGLRQIEEVETFRPLHYEHFEKVGVDKVSKHIAKFKLFGKPVVLLCFYDISKPN